MKINGIKVICFSPSGSSRKIAEAVACGIDEEYVVIDLTLPAARKNYEADFTDDLVILAAPVHFGRLEATAAKLFATLRANKTPIVLLVVYGNRHYDDALAELTDIAVSGGFIPVAAASFIAAHSFDSPEHPIAAGRPDVKDIDRARSFGAAIADKVGAVVDIGGIDGIAVPGNRPYKEYGAFTVTPVSTDACKKCGKCASVCPKEAISIGEYVVTKSPPVCIFCHACVKACPNKARVVTAQSILDVYNRLSTTLAARREPEIFI